MIAELGHFSLALAGALAFLLGIVMVAGPVRRSPSWSMLARPAAQAQCLFVVISFFCLAWSFVQNDFSVQYVASHSNSALPLPYRIAAVWGGHEGSMLLWVTMLSIWMLAVSVFSAHLPDELVATILGVMGWISVGFIAFVLLVSNPFARLLPAALDGRDLNPLLQDPGMVFHPPLLYMGYVGFSVAFSFALAALIGGRLDATWARWSRPWTLAAWSCLTLGIALGSWWAYYELGWGGWWFWDPVENASFMPWLLGTALLHSLCVTEKRGAFRGWTVLLAICAFALSLLGTFLVRSGILTSVHAFATDPKRGIFILGFMVLVIGVSLILFAWRAPRIGRGGDFALLSREGLMLGGNVVLVVAAASVMLGTLYPLVLDALGLGKISVGAPYFEAIFVPLLAPALLLMGIAPIARWKRMAWPDMVRQIRIPALFAVASALVLPFALERATPLIVFGILLAFWIGLSTLRSFATRIFDLPNRGIAGRLAMLPRSYYGMLFAHAGVAAFIFGVTMVKGYEVEKDVRMAYGDTVEVGSYKFRFEGVKEVEGVNYIAAVGEVTVLQLGAEPIRLYPEKRLYRVQRMPMTEAAIDSGLSRDLYVSLGEAVSDTAWTLRIYVKPFVDWIWGGCILMAIGGALAATDRRYRLRSRTPKTAAEADLRSPVAAADVAT